MKRYLLRLIGAAAVSVWMLCGTVFAGEWKSDENGWKYQKDDGTCVTENWYVENDDWYYFGVDGYMATDMWVASRRWSYVGSDGKMLKDTVTPDGYTVNYAGNLLDNNRNEVVVTNEKLGQWHLEQRNKAGNGNSVVQEQPNALISWKDITITEMSGYFSNPYDGANDMAFAAYTVNEVRQQANEPSTLEIVSIDACVSESRTDLGEPFAKRLMVVGFADKNSSGVRVKSYYVTYYDKRDDLIKSYNNLDFLNYDEIKSSKSISVVAVLDMIK